ncbi:MAG: divergent PAP2 family protein [Candidatus Omnitrophota bacterium]
MEGFWPSLLKNKALWVVLLSWMFAQGLKIAIGAVKERRFNFYWLLGTGGMPSSHSAAVVSLAFCMGKEIGFSSPFFALSTIFALVTMFDAQTWRRSIGVQARILNRMIEDLQVRKKIEEHRLRELVGHTPIEVFVGALIGIIIPLLFY